MMTISFRTTLFSLLACVGIASAATVSLSGTIYDKDNKPLPGVIVSLAQAGLADTTGADGTWLLAGRSAGIAGHLKSGNVARWTGKSLSLTLPTSSLVQVDAYDIRGARLGRVAQAQLEAGSHELPVMNARSATGMRWLLLTVNGQTQVISTGGSVKVGSNALPGALGKAALDSVEQIIYTLQGQLITSDTITNLIQSGLSKWIQEFSVSGKVTGDAQVVVDTIFAWFDGGRMTGLRRARLGYNKANLAYSGRIYTVKSLMGDVFNYRVWLNVMGNGNKRTGISDTTDFSSDFGAIDFIPVFSVSNAIPAGGITGVVTGLVNTSFEFGISLIRKDELIARYEWDNGEGKGFVAGATKLTTKWLQPGSFVVRARLTDIDSNQSILTKTVNITNQAAVVAGIRDTAITPSDVVVFSVNATDKDGVAKVLWNFGDGTKDSTFGGPVHTVSHKYPSPEALKLADPVADSMQRDHGRAFPLTVTVIDSLGNSTIQTAQITVYDDIPTVYVADTMGEPDSLLTLHALARDRGTITKVEWSVNGTAFVASAKDTTIKLPATVTQNYPVYVRVTDDDGNVSKVDTIKVGVFKFLKDTRDGKRYRTVTIGSQTWMAENLNYRADSSYCYNNDTANCATYGRLYKWGAAMGLKDSCLDTLKSCANQITPKMQGACPSGWHVPSDGEWTKLTDTTLAAATAGIKLKANSRLWGGGTSDTARGTDDYSFTVLPGGGRFNSGMFYCLVNFAYFWSASEVNRTGAWCRSFDYYNARLSRNTAGMSLGYSLRCLQDN